MGGTTEGLLVLSNGRFFRGKLRGAPVEATGEVIFNTSMTGYQEILTDPSYTGQIVTMTYPQIGNYGVNADDMESKSIHASALIVCELSHMSSNWRATQSLDEWLIKHRIPVLEGVDTRSLVKAIRSGGECSGLLVPSDSLHTLDELREEALDLPSMVGQNLARQVSTRESYFWPSEEETKPITVIAYDFGIKYNILRIMNSLGISVTVVPWNTSAEEVLEMNPEGIFLSNGPGDPAATGKYAIKIIQKLIKENIPIFGICLGHQILALALNAKTKKMKLGHRGANHPVKNLLNKKVEITSQNHGFEILKESLPKNVEITHKSLFDNCIEGIKLKNKPVFSVQYHPESNPGPQDSVYLFKQFINEVKKYVKKKRY